MTKVKWSTIAGLAVSIWFTSIANAQAPNAPLWINSNFSSAQLGLDQTSGIIWRNSVNLPSSYSPGDNRILSLAFDPATGGPAFRASSFGKLGFLGGGFYFNGGNVGIGTTNPTQALQVYNGDIQSLNFGGESRLRLTNASRTGHDYWLISGGAGGAFAGGGFGIWDNTVGQSRFIVKSSGNVGIGNSNPAAKLSVMTPTSYGNDASYALHAVDGSNPLKRLVLGYDDSINAGVIASAHSGTAWVNTIINPSGGNVGVGTINPGAGVWMAGGLDINGFGSTQFTIEKNGASSFALNAGSSGPGVWTMYDFFGGHWNSSITSSNGRVGIGSTVVPLASLDVSAGGLRANAGKPSAGDGSNVGYAFGADGDTGMFKVPNTWESMTASYGGDIAFTINSQERMRIGDNGSVGIGTNNPNATLAVAGNGSFTQNVTAPTFTMTSDARLKREITSMPSPLTKVLSLRPVTFYWNNLANSVGIKDTKMQMGFVAQEIQKVFPDAIETNPNGYKSVNYSSLIAPLMGSMKEFYSSWQQQTAKFDQELKAKDEKIKVLEARIDRLEGILLKQNQAANSSEK